MNGAPVKRQRPNKSCTICREKKTKCDREKPICGTCKKRNQSVLCRYEGPEWTIKVGDQNFVTPVQSSVKKPRVKKHTQEQLPYQQQFQVNNVRIPQTRTESVKSDDAKYTNRLRVESLLSPSAPPSMYSASGNSDRAVHSIDDNDADGDDILDFYKDNYVDPGVFADGTLTWVTLLKKDIYSRALVICFNKNAILKKIKNSQMDDHFFTNKFMAEDDTESAVPECPAKTSGIAGKNFIESLRDELKDNKLTWLLIEKFFESELYCNLPILDKEDFTEQISRIIPPRDSKSGDNKLNITGKFQLAALGILLMVMRFSSLSVYNAGKPLPQPISPNDQYIVDHPVTKDVVTLAKACLEELSVLKQSHLVIFQLSLLLQHYNFFAPEDCDCITASTITNMGPLLHHAISSGLNRDPTVSRPKYPKPNLLRRLWYLLEYMDYYQLMLVGYAPIINHSFHDTQIPILDHNDSALQYVINEAFHDRRKIHEVCRPLLMLILNVREPPKIRDVLNQMKGLEEHVEKIPKYDELLRMPSDTVIHRYNKLRIHNGTADSCALLFMIYYNFFLHYNDKRNSEKSLYYMLQLLRISKYLYTSVHFLRKPDEQNEKFNLNKHFGIGILALPKIELCLHKISEFMIALLGRIKVHKAVLGLNVDQQRLELLDKIGRLTFKICYFIVDACANISDTYYHAWSISKIQSFIIEKVFINREGRLGPHSLTQIEAHYVEVVEELRSQDDGFFLYSTNDLKQILNALELMDTESLGQTPSPERLLTDLNSYKSKNDQLWFDQMMFENSFNVNEGGNNSANFNGFSNNNGIGNNTPVTANNVPMNELDLQEIPDLWDPFRSNTISDLEQMFHYTINDY